MTSGIQTTVLFSCSGCRAVYEATKEQHQDKHSGSFSCQDCNTVVHAWSDVYDFFDWRTQSMRPYVFGDKIF